RECSRELLRQKLRQLGARPAAGPAGSLQAASARHHHGQRRSDGLPAGRPLAASSGHGQAAPSRGPRARYGDPKRCHGCLCKWRAVAVGSSTAS
ncbi:unnamed protein product, partial [Polarella glacialis]